MKSGIPFDVALSLPDSDVLAYCVVFGKIDGNGDFDWSTLKWRRRE